MEKRHDYETTVSWAEGEGGRIEAASLPTLSTAPPPEFGGSGGNWSPEHLFVSSANACVLFTFLAMAGISKLEIRGWRSTAKGTVERLEDQGWLFSGIELEVELTVTKPSDVERAERLVHKAEKNCLVSKSMKTPVKLVARVSAA
jgi:organic hydroperoxide reductase OsmC/OhrA